MFELLPNHEIWYHFDIAYTDSESKNGNQQNP